ncbi:hypothetical protein LLG10_00070 [bacterium]|nr:hypothetical protein [bacterium]
MVKPAGFKGFAILTVGQLTSMIGSSMTQFGLGIWIWNKTGNATPFSIIAVCFMVPNLLFSPIAGTLIDRWPKKRGLILPDLSAGLITILLLILFSRNLLTLPILYVGSFFSGVFNSLQWPAYSVTMTLSGPLVDKVLTPLFQEGLLISTLFGAGKGGAIGFLAALGGFLTILVTIIAFLTPFIMNVEKMKS